MKPTIQARSGLAALALIVLTLPAAANNMAVTNVTLLNQNRGNKTVELKFDLRWDNSWYGPCADPAYTNWDATWVFVKFRAPGSNTWQHALLSANNADHTVGNGGVIAVGTNDASGVGVGVFVSSSGANTGTVTYTGTLLKWNYGANGYDFGAGASVDVSVVAIEMVYVPQGPFYVGSGGTENGSLTEGNTGTVWVSGTTPSVPFRIASEAQLTVSNAAGCLWGTTNNGTYNSIGGIGVLSIAFPKGFNAFYCMKYEVTQGQYCDFLNKLTSKQAGNRYSSSSAGSGYTIGTNTVGVFTNAAPDRACNFLSPSDAASYAAWAGLRPMTELEFEKACRGPVTPVANEYSWGSTTITQLRTESGTSGSGTETVGTLSGANCCYGYWSTMLQPTRVGLFATASTTTRQAAGASYWGIMELSGNVSERCVTVGNTTYGRGFTGSLGSGELDPNNGSATNAGWSLYSLRGGSWSYTSNGGPCISDRAQGAYVDATRYAANGFRAVRPAP